MANGGPGSAGLEAALGQLISDGTLDAEQARKVHEAIAPLVAEAHQQDDEPEGSSERFVEVLAYIGGALVLAAVAVIASLMWDDIGRPGQIAGCLGATVILLGAAYALGADTPRRHTLRGVLASLASGTAGLGGAVIAYAITDDDFSDTAVLGAAIGVLAVAVPFYALWRGSALVLAWVAGGWIATGYLLNSTGSGSWDNQRPVIFFAAYGVLVWAIGWLIPERNAALSLALGTVGFAAALGSFDGDSAWYALGLAIIVVVTSFALFAQFHYNGFAAVGAVTALFVPAAAMSTITGSAVVVASVLSAVGLALIAGAVISARRSRAA